MIFNYIIIVLGLVFFEIITSVDNAVINANVLKTLEPKYRKFFLFWGILFAVFVVRGLLPFLIVWMANSELTVYQVFNVAFSNDPQMKHYVERSTPLLLLGGGVYLLLTFLGWLFLEEKRTAFFLERFIGRQKLWFYAVFSVIFALLIYFSLKRDPLLALSVSIGSCAFFIADGFKRNAEEQETKLINPGVGAISKILYLEILDMSFSIDGVVGAFAFTTAIPLILIGNGIGAFVVREFTVRGIDVISKYAYLKNGAMYSVGLLGAVMILESFGKEQPFWFAPLNTFLILAIFFYLSWRETKMIGRKCDLPYKFYADDWRD